jgi:hypothetical protein
MKQSLNKPKPPVAAKPQPFLRNDLKNTQDFFTLSCLVKDLNQYFLVYNKFGLSSHLNACNAVSSLRSSYVGSLKATKRCAPFKFEGMDISRSYKTSRCVATDATIESALLSLEMLSRAPASKIENLLLVVGSAISLQDIAVNAASGNIPTGYHGAEKRSGTESPQKEVPFKLSRDYTFDEEGFEDWSFLNQERPYDTLVRENIFELLEDLEKTDGTSVKWNVESANDSSLTTPVSFADLTRQAALKAGTNGAVVAVAAQRTQEHLLSSEIHKVYTNRLRLKQRIKQFYGLVTQQSFRKSGIGVDNDDQSLRSEIQQGGTSSSSSVWNSLLKLEDRLDIQVFRLKWAGSIAAARQMLKHKHIGIIKGKDSSIVGATSLPLPLRGDVRLLDSTAKVATANMFLNSGDLLYRRIPLSVAQQRTSQFNNEVMSSHQFPWFAHLQSNSSSPLPLRGDEQQGEDNVPLVLSLTTQHGSISLSDGQTGVDLSTDRSYGPKATGTDLKQQQLCYSHYKHMYCIRSSEIPTKEYLRLPQSSIHKNEWKAFLESSIAV